MRNQLRAYRVLMSLSFSVARREAILFLGCGAIMALTPVAVVYGAKLLVDAAAAHDVHRGLFAAALMAFSAGLGLVNVLYYVDLLFTVADKASAEADRRLMALTAGIPGLEHHERPRYLDEMDLLREERSLLAWMTNATAGMLRVAVQLISSGILLARLHPALLLLPLAGYISFVVGRRAQDIQIRAMERTTETERLRKHLFGLATSAETGKETRVFGVADELIRRHRLAARHANGPRYRAYWQGAVLQALGGLITGGAYIGAVTLVLVRAVNGQGTPGDVVLAVGLAATLNYTIFIAVSYGTQFLRVLRMAHRYLWLEEYAAHARADMDAVEAAQTVPQSLQRGIRFDRISFRYPDTERLILDDVSLTLPPGTVVAIVGDNGAGKTTLMKLLSRFYEPTAGAITVDGVDLRHFDVEAWRAHIAAAFQDFVRFELPVREAVGIGDIPRLEDVGGVEGALARAGATTVVEELPRGLDTQLGKNWEGGVDLSGGQWQKLALGRAMMRDLPLVLILDEPTASLDPQTEHELFERYARAAREGGSGAGTVTILVSHRFSTVRMADLIVVLDDGRIKEAGSHEGLMASGGLYAELYELQARAYR